MYEKCFSVPHDMKCPHCSEKFCGKCLESFRDELVLEIKKLDGVIHQSTDFVKEGSFVKRKKKKETDSINNIKQTIQSHKDELDRLEK